MLLTEEKRQLIKTAFRRFGNGIRPIGKAKSFCDPHCFTIGVGKIFGGKLQFWFEDSRGSSHLIIDEEKNGNKTNIKN
jgi:hypothetical protein